MDDEYSRAISFANSYFALVDGLATGLENHLAEDVVLDWFGKTVKGRANVTAFMKAHKVNSRHIFANITPTASIGYRRQHRSSRKALRPSRGPSDSEGVTEGVVGKQLDFDKLQTFDASNDDNNNNDIPEASGTDGANSTTILDAEGNRVDEDETYELSENDLDSLFRLEIASTRIEEIEDSIERIKLEEIAGAMRTLKTERGQGDGPGVAEASSVKYVEANGQIQFSKKTLKRGTPLHTWKRHCRLQIAYSVAKAEERRAFEPSKPEARAIPGSIATLESSRGRLLSLEEIGELSGRLVPNDNDFAGYLRAEVDFFEEREIFLARLRAELAASRLLPQYVDDRLVLGRARSAKTEKREEREGFVFNYVVHLIIYEGSNRCRLDLSRQFVQRA